MQRSYQTGRTWIRDEAQPRHSTIALRRTAATPGRPGLHAAAAACNAWCDGTPGREGLAAESNANLLLLGPGQERDQQQARARRPGQCRRQAKGQADELVVAFSQHPASTCAYTTSILQAARGEEVEEEPCAVPLVS
jgi:hypothetical protein